MSGDCCRPDYDSLFNERAARRELDAYRRRGARGTTRHLLDAIRAQGVGGGTIIDIGGGVGVIGAELLADGAEALTSVDASGPYLCAARGEIERRGFGERATFRHGDFVELAADVDAADIVTLNRVICCYGDWEALVGRSVERARHLYGVVIPRDRWWMRIPIALVRSVGRLFGQAYPFHVHPERKIDERVRAAGFELVFARRGLAWQTLLYRRAS
jgi:2-polyprenyl-3-methyl-5-hydroxy-6-metoxy-1,4-benzoquinol methylase